MKIERVIIRDLRALKSRDDTFVGPDGVFSAACLRGVNGSGKTTYLEAIAELWSWFCDSASSRGSPGTIKGALADAGLVAVLFTGLPGPHSQLWVVWERHFSGYYEFISQTPAYVGGKAGVELFDDQTFDWWEKALAGAELGAERVPNLVFIEAEHKFVAKLSLKEYRVPAPAPAYLRLVNQRGAGHLELMMRTLSLARRDRWKALILEFARLRPNLQLLDRFDERTQRPLFQLSDGTLLTVDMLSAGERSVLINLCVVLRWLAPGGIVLLDEPELHQHLSLMRGSIAVTQALIERMFDGQLLVASHSPEVWDHFRMSGALVDLDA
ncbi:MAG: AAA family ATPase [Myxococcota bacterium]